MWNLNSIIVVILMLTSGLFFPVNFNDDIGNAPAASITAEDPDAEDVPSAAPEGEPGTSSRAGASGTHGGAWVDPFDDDTKMDLTKSDLYRIDASQAMIDKSYLIDANAVAVWHMDEGTGIYAEDATPNNNRGILGGDGQGSDLPSWTTGNFGGALDFDGSDTLDCGRRPSLNITSELTISAWVNVNVWTTGGRIACRYGSSNPDQGYIMWINRVGSTNYIRFGVEDPTLGFESIETISTANMQTGKWIHAVGVYDGSNLKMYVDGVLDNSKSTFVNSIRIAATNLYIGSGPFMNYPFWGKIDEVSVYNKGLTAAEVLSLYQTGAVKSNPSANITSKQITLPAGMKWDTVMINKTNPNGAFLNITIRNPVNNQIIPGTPVFTEAGEFDISQIDPVQYPSIKLNASFKTQNTYSAALRCWGVSWKEPNSWADSFQTDYKVDSYYNVIVTETELQFTNGAYIITKPISLPGKDYYSTFLINYIEPDGTHFRLTAIDALTGSDIIGYTNLEGSSIDISGIDPYAYPSICLKIRYQSGGIKGSLYDYSINWMRNKSPVFLEVFSLTSVYRTDSIEILINLTDETPEDELLIELEYQTPKGTIWRTDYLTAPVFTDDRWSSHFNPLADAQIGNYTFRLACEDFYNDRTTYSDQYIIEVKNNLPSQPVVTITSSNPKSTDNLQVTVSALNDIETSYEDLELWYYWFKDDVETPELRNTTIISELLTTKNEVWRSVVHIFDGDDIGPAGSAEVIIQNTPPAVVDKVDLIELNEDQPVVFNSRLGTIFSDIDDDVMSYSAENWENIQVGIIQSNGTVMMTPAENWYGTEYITFYANDSEMESELTIKTVVNPTNDLPVITQLGSQRTGGPSRELEFTVKQDETIRLKVYVEDIDGDVERGMIYYILNISETETLYFDLDKTELVFMPDNADVGWHYIDIAVTDNNETPMQYVSQPVKIHVINVNDAPSVEIKMPKNSMELSQSDKLTFTCESDDPDLNIPDPTEKLTYRWFALTPEPIELGTGKTLVNPKLPAGYITITVEVTDSSDTVASDSVTINVKETESETSELSAGMIALFALIPIIIIALVLFMFLSKRKKKGQEGSAVQPEVVSPYTGAPVTPAPAKTVVVTAPRAQPALPQTAAAQELSADQKLRMLDEQLVKGAIGQALYNDLKAKYEAEARPPQLPTTTPSPTPSPMPAPTPVPALPPVKQK